MFLLHETSSSGMFLDFSPEQMTFHALPKVYNTQTLLITLPRFCSCIYEKLAINRRKNCEPYTLRIPKKRERERDARKGGERVLVIYLTVYQSSFSHVSATYALSTTASFSFLSATLALPLFFLFRRYARTWLPSLFCVCPFFDFLPLFYEDF